MKRKFNLLITCIIISLTLQAQTNYLQIAQGVKLPKDSIERKNLIESLDHFLQDTTIYGRFVKPEAKEETAILLSEIKDVQKRHKQEDNIKPYLTNLIPIGKTDYMLELSFMGIKNEQPTLHAIVNFMATPKDKAFLFSSPLQYNTKGWHNIKDGYLTAFYQDKTDKSYAQQRMKYIKQFDEMLGGAWTTTNYYCRACNNMSDLLRLMGIIYSELYSGENWIMIDFFNKKHNFCFYPKRFFESGIIDPHDTFHSRAYSVIPQEKRNRFMICGCAYIYCGSWLISWQDIQKRFKEAIDYKNEKDWLQLYFERYNFGVSKKRHLLVTQFVNALIIQKVEKEQGFSAVKKLLASGNMYKNRDEFFQILEKVTGINEQNFNKKVSKLIDDAMEKI